MGPRALSAAALVVLLASCGGGGTSGPQSRATFVINGASMTISLGPGTVQDSFGTDKRLNYSGPGGCEGRYFTGESLNGWSLAFRHSSRDAYLIYNTTVYHFITGPRRQGSGLEWAHTFPDYDFRITVFCPPPPQSGPLLPLSY
jgi:hypothetical protein